MVIIKHLLKGKGIKFTKTPNLGGKFLKDQPDTIIIHYTAGSSAASSINTLTTPSSKASAHLVIGRDGSITQLAPFNIITWHAGESQHGERIGINKYSIGIEIDNAGPLTKRSDGYYSWFGKKYDESETVYAIHRNQAVARYWHSYTEEQITTVYNICNLLSQTYDIKYILGHEEISPKRKEDPGPAFPLNKLRDKILSGARDADADESEIIVSEREVLANTLNIRSAPEEAAEKVATPLKKGAKVKVLESEDGWYRVQAVVEGWVSAKYVK